MILNWIYKQSSQVLKEPNHGQFYIFATVFIKRFNACRKQ